MAWDTGREGTSMTSENLEAREQALLEEWSALVGEQVRRHPELLRQLEENKRAAARGEKPVPYRTVIAEWERRHGRSS